jgi:hypothetical protein
MTDDFGRESKSSDYSCDEGERAPHTNKFFQI